MKKEPLIVFISILFLLISCRVKDENIESAIFSPVNYVDPYIGTGGHGHTFLGVAAPFGAVQIGPNNINKGWDWCSGYHYSDSIVIGFSHLHLNGTGCSDTGDLLFMPYTGKMRTQPGTQDNPLSGYASYYSKSDETALPGYYGVVLKTHRTKVELTASDRVAFHRYTFPKNVEKYVMINLKDANGDDRPTDTYLEQVNDTTVSGYRCSSGWSKQQQIYFTAVFSEPIRLALFHDSIPVQGNVLQGIDVKGNVIVASDVEKLDVKVGISPVSMENAAANIRQEIADWNFERVVDETTAKWNAELSKLQVSTTDTVAKRIFYTALYHTMVQPNTMSDVNGEYMAADYTTRKVADNEVHYSTFSLWDTFRAAHPLYTLLHTDRIPDFIKSMMRQYDYYGYLPVWQLWGQDNYCMIGNHSIPVIVDAVLKGVAGVDAEKAYEAVHSSSIVSHPNFPFEVWEKYGYMPEDIQTQSVSITLEQAFDDWCVALLARKLGKEEDYGRFMKRSAFYRNLFNAETKFFQPKNKKGEWMEPFDPYKYGANGGYPFTEGNAWQYFWYVPQNIPDLISLTGGNKAFTAKLDTFFTVNHQSGELNDNASGFVGQYAHGNEPSHHVAYLYACAGEPWKTQKYVAHIMNELYNDSSSGYAGNDDCGEMSAWYVFGALGFYPVNPVSGKYIIGTPMLEEAVIQLPDGKTFTIKAPRKEHNEIYIRSMRLNGKKYTKNYITHQDIMNGGTLEFVMTASPGK